MRDHAVRDHAVRDHAVRDHGRHELRAAALVLADGSVFEGELIGADPLHGIAGGEVVFMVHGARWNRGARRDGLHLGAGC